MSTLLNVIRTAELRNKILFTLFILVIYRLGVQIPAPGVDLGGLEALRVQSEQGDGGGVWGYLTLFTGGGVVLSLFGLGILPYITASIVIQILTVAVPKLEEWQSQGAVGQRKITQWTRYLTIVLSLIQSAGFVFLISRSPEQLYGENAPQLFPDGSPVRMLLAILCITTGVAILMWLGEMITQRGIGNGMSVLIFASVVAGLPALGRNILQIRGGIWFAVCMLVMLLLCLGIVFIEQGQRRIPINFPKRVVGNRQYGGNKTYIPLKVNQAGVIPVIFASSLLQLPSLVSNVLPTNEITQDSWGDSVRRFIQARLLTPTDPAYIITFGLLIIGFAYFYNSIAFDPARRADELRKSGGFITGIRPGPQTESYLSKVLNRITLPGSVFLATIALIPSALLYQLIGDNNSTLGLLGFSGVSILIGVGVSLELMKQINSQLMAQNYEGFLK